MKKIIFNILRYSGLPFLFRELFQRNKVTIVMFHDVSREIAEQSFSYLSKKYNIIDLNEFVEAYEEKNESKIPKKALIITFDDGHIRNYEILPILKKYNIPITIFLCSSIINTKRNYWFLYSDNAINVENLKLKSDVERQEFLKKVGFEKEKEFSKPQALQRDHIEQMNPYVNFQAHTMFHPILPKCDDEVAQKEIFQCKETLENDYGMNINAFAYPNGDYSERDVTYVKNAKYKCAVTVEPGYNSMQTDIFRLKRFSVNDTNNLNELIVKSSGVWSLIKSIKP